MNKMLSFPTNHKVTASKTRVELTASKLKNSWLGVNSTPVCLCLALTSWKGQLPFCHDFVISCFELFPPSITLSDHLGQARFCSKGFEPGSDSRLCSVVVRVRVVLKRTVVGDSD